MTNSRGLSSRQDLLKEADQNPIRTLLQIEGTHTKHGDFDYCPFDQDGDTVSVGMTEGVVNRPTDFVVRVQINPLADREDVQRLLMKIVKDLTVAFDSMSREALEIITTADTPLSGHFLGGGIIVPDFSDDTDDSTEKEQKP